jgi:DNA modification methylase
MLIRADARAVPLRDGSVDCCVTSPPYWGLRDYGTPGHLGLEPTPEKYVAAMVEVFREVRRVLRPSGTLWLNLGDSYHSGNRGGYRNDTHRWDSSPIQRRTTGTHMEAVSPNRLPQEGLKDKDLVGIPWRVAFALQADGWWLRSDIIWSKPNPMPESVTDRPTKAHEYVFLLAKSERYYFGQEAVREPHTHPDAWRNTGDRSTVKELDRPYALAISRPKDHIGHKHGRNVRTVWTIATQPYAGAHFATFPEDLARRCILAGCPEGGVVLDPFSGSGTTVRVARSLGRYGIGLELNPQYIRLAQERTRVTQGFSFGGAA